MPFIDAGSCEPLRVWSRLEPRTRETDFADALAARIQDPMFMLGRQWQFGEFAGEDTGSAVLATLARSVTPVVAAGAGSDDGLDPVVERLPMDLPLIVRARLGRALMSRLDAAAAAAVAAGTLTPAYDPDAYRRLFAGVFGPLDPDPIDALNQARDRAAPRVGRVRDALRGRSVDGVRVFAAVRAGMVATELPPALIAGVAPGHLGMVLAALESYRSWFATTYAMPAPASIRWEADQLEYAVERDDAR